MLNTKVDEILNTILGYRDIALLGAIMNKEDAVEWHSFDIFWPSFASELTRLQHYIKYEYFNYILWLKLMDCKGDLSRIEQVIQSHSDLPIEDYVLGLKERNSLIWQDIDLLTEFKFMENKVILDFGYGSGFYSTYFVIKGGHVYGIEKPDIYAYVGNPVSNSLFTPLTLLYKLPELIDIVWLSEVIHGKSEGEIIELIQHLKEHMKPESLLVINELKSNTPLSKHFNIQMKLHTSGGKLYSMQNIIDLIPFKKISVLREFNYHYWIGGTLE